MIKNGIFKPGPELDALVAEKVMGVPTVYETGISQDEYERRRKRIDPPYSTDISAAFEVVNYMKERGLRCAFHLVGPHDQCKSWFAHFDKKYSFYTIKAEPICDQWDGMGDTAPHAICLAALEAVKCSAKA